MSQTPEYKEYRLPDWTASYFINDDPSGLKDQEIEQIKDFLETHKVRVVDMKDDSSFYISNDLDRFGNNCSTFIAVSI